MKGGLVTLLLLSLYVPCVAQTSMVTATVVDSDGIARANGSWTAAVSLPSAAPSSILGPQQSLFAATVSPVGGTSGMGATGVTTDAATHTQINGVSTPNAQSVVTTTNANQTLTVYPVSGDFRSAFNTAVANCKAAGTSQSCNIQLQTGGGTQTLSNYLLVRATPNVHVTCATKDPINLTFNALSLYSSPVGGVPRYAGIVEVDASDNFTMDDCHFNIQTFSENAAATAPAINIWGSKHVRINNVSILSTTTPLLTASGLLGIRTQGNPQYYAEDVIVSNSSIQVPFIALSTGNYSRHVNFEHNYVQNSYECYDFNGTSASAGEPSSQHIIFSHNTCRNIPGSNYVESASHVTLYANTYINVGLGSSAFSVERVHSIEPFNDLDVTSTDELMVGNPSGDAGFQVFNGASNVHVNNLRCEGIATHCVDLDTSEGGLSNISINGVNSVNGGSLNSKGLTGITLVSPGTGYVQGELLHPVDATGSDAIVQVNSVDSNGSILTYSLNDLGFGHGYTGGAATSTVAASLPRSGTYTSGITATGTAGQTCALAFAGPSYAQVAVALTGTNTVGPGSPLIFSSDPNRGGNLINTPPTVASVSNGTATCSGTATASTSFSGLGATFTTTIPQQPFLATSLAIDTANIGTGYTVGSVISIPCGANARVAAVNGSGGVTAIAPYTNRGSNCTTTSSQAPSPQATSLQARPLISGAGGTGLKLKVYTDMAAVRIGQGNGFIVAGGWDISKVNATAGANPYLTADIFEAGDTSQSMQQITIHENSSDLPLDLNDPCTSASCWITDNNAASVTVQAVSVGLAVASATTIAPTSAITHVAGTTPISTITPPASMRTVTLPSGSSGTGVFGGCLYLLMDGPAQFTTGGNIHAAYTPTAGQKVQACFDGSQWFIP